MGIAEELSEEVLKRCNDIRISEYCVGLKYSYVEISTKSGKFLGVSYVPYEDLYSGCTGRKPELSALKEMISGTNPIERSLALSTINGLSQYLIWTSEERENAIFGDLIEKTVEEIPSHGRILVIGNMRPLIEKLKSLGHKVICLERNARYRGSCLPDVYLRRLRGWPDALIVSGTSLLNDTVDEIVEMFSGTFKGIVGPTAGSLPKILLKYFDFVSSMKIERIEETKEIIKLGGGRWAFTPYTRQYMFASP